ncbi:MAG TPA: phosphoglucosamine mutase, partial [Alphaproteobacteria bacterium]|nr:phosphoglucosamine mutase [Alphaproteobacteria bacterium]
MARKFFGTDGIRGMANVYPMTAEVALKVGMAAGRVFRRGEHRHQVVIGKDTRRSGYMIEYAMTAGFNSVGMDVLLFGPIPTPAVAMLTRSMRADLGVMISASHNPYEDNGIKLFGPDGYKLSDEVELEIEKYLQEGPSEGLAEPAHIGRSTRIEDAQARYIEFVKATLPRSLRLDGMKIVVDCAHGAAYKVAPTVLWELGAEVIRLGTEPNGYNINRQSGSTAPQAMCEAVRMHGADLGIALDGDADRVIVADENGAVIDGDQVMALIARRWANEGRLKGGGVVSTVMSNLGFERYLASLGL